MVNIEKNSNPEQSENEAQSTEAAVAAEQPAINQAQIEADAIQALKQNQSLVGGILGGFLGAVIGAALWAIATVITGYQIGYMALAVGFIVGFLVRKFGHGFEQKYGYIGAAWALIGCFAGNILMIFLMMANELNIPYLEVLELVSIDSIISITKETFEFMDLVFYGIAVYEGYKFSFMTKAEVTEKLSRLMNSRAA